LTDQDGVLQYALPDPIEQRLAALFASLGTE